MSNTNNTMITPARSVNDIPKDTEAEKAVLGSIIYNNDLMSETAKVLTPQAFFATAHQYIYEAILELVESNQPIDEIILGNHLKSANRLKEVGGYAYLAELVESAPGSANIVYYAKIIQENALLRELISTAGEIGQKGRDPEQNISELLAEAEKKIAEISNRSTNRGYTHIKHVLGDNFKHLEQVSKINNDITGLATGFLDLDNLTAGLQPSDLIILAARPSMGKTALALNIAGFIGRSKPKGSILFFSLEMSKEQLAMRLLGSESKIDGKRLRSGRLNQNDWDNLAMHTNKLSEMPIYINDSSNLTPYELVTISKQLNKEFEGGLSLMVVDYLQLMQSSKPGAFREQEIAEISRSLKGVAKELNIPVLALSQLNRAVESRTDKRPQMADLRESGSIEQDADIILFIYRDEVYNEDSPDKGVAEINIAKHRNGPTGKVRLVFDGKYTKFANFSDQSPPDF